ncbi:MAG: glycosyltransferase [Actinobacteria bacterium]|nr:glycosyltransferase [Actinomycetota bacterium]
MNGNMNGNANGNGNDTTPPPVIGIFRSTLLSSTEGFISRQAEAVPGVVPYYLGLTRLAGAPLPADRVLVTRWRPTPLRKLAFAIGRDPAFNKLLRHLQPALLHAHFGPDAAMLLPTARRARVPLVVSFHGYDVMLPDGFHRSPAGRLWLRRRAAVFAQAELLIAVSEAVRARLIELGAPPEKVVCHHIGVDTSVFGGGLDTEPDNERDPAHVLFVGRLAEVKGVGDLLEAAAIARSTTPSLTLTVVGDGPLRDQLHARATQLELPVQFIDSATQLEVAALMASATLLCAPSKATASGQREAFGLVLAEAQASGLPVVAYRSGGTGEALTHEVGGLLVPEGDVVALATALTELLTHPTRRAALGAAGREEAHRRFDLAAQSAQLGEMYRAVIARHANAADDDNNATGPSA